jgi:hypothetical protein
MSAETVSRGATVLHQHRGSDDRVAITKYRVAEVRDGIALLKRPGTRRLTRVPVQTLLTSPAWAIQEVLC